jgi:hypothetical protein
LRLKPGFLGILIDNYEYIFGPSSIYLPKGLILTPDGFGTIPDGFAFDLFKKNNGL